MKGAERRYTTAHMNGLVHSGINKIKNWKLKKHNIICAFIISIPTDRKTLTPVYRYYVL